MKRGLKIFIWALVIVLLLVSIGIFVNYYFFGNDKTQEFDLDTLFLKVALKEGGESVNNIKVTNINSYSENFSIQINGINNLIKLDEYNFVLEPDKTKNIKIIFNASNQNSGVYLGALKIFSNGNTKEVPIILEIETKEVLFDGNLNLFPQTTNIIPGQKLNAEIKIFDLTTIGIGKSNLELTYAIKSFDGRNIIFESENVVVDTRLDYSRSIDLPKNIRLGDYVLYTLLKYKNSTGTSSAFFKIIDEKESSQQASNKIIYLIIGLFGFFFLIFLGLFVYSLFFRDKMMKDMELMYKRELRKQRELIKGQRKLVSSESRNPREKKEFRKELSRVEKQRIKALKELRRHKIKEFKSIKKHYKGNDLQKQLNKWKKQGYDTNVLDKTYKLPDIKSIRKKINKWKKQGYDTRVLRKK
ncbi:MAG: hypothetical protein AABW67_04435 [Nanoarchaeota archaeon]